MSEKDVEQKGQYMDILKAKMPEFKKRYGKKALDVMGGVAAKQAIRTPD
jgi:tRNA A37 threonylcarbamoyltransferase TsaD